MGDKKLSDPEKLLITKPLSLNIFKAIVRAVTSYSEPNTGDREQDKEIYSAAVMSAILNFVKLFESVYGVRFYQNFSEEDHKAANEIEDLEKLFRKPTKERPDENKT